MSVGGPGRGAGPEAAGAPVHEIQKKPKRTFGENVAQGIARFAKLHTVHRIGEVAGRNLRGVASNGQERNIEDALLVSPRLNTMWRNFQERFGVGAARLGGVDIVYKGQGQEAFKVDYTTPDVLPKNATPEQQQDHRMRSVFRDVAMAADRVGAAEIAAMMPDEEQRTRGHERQEHRIEREHPDLWVGQDRNGYVMEVLRYDSDKASDHVRLNPNTGQPEFFVSGQVEDKVDPTVTRVSIAKYRYVPGVYDATTGRWTDRLVRFGDENTPENDLLNRDASRGQLNVSSEQHMRFVNSMASRLASDSTDIAALQAAYGISGNVATYIEAVQGGGDATLRGQSDEQVRQRMQQRISNERAENLNDFDESGHKVVLLRGLGSVESGRMQEQDALRINGIDLPRNTMTTHRETIEGREYAVAQEDKQLSPRTAQLLRELPTEYARQKYMAEFGEELDPESGEQLTRVRIVETRFPDGSAEAEQDGNLHARLNTENELNREHERAIIRGSFDEVPSSALKDPAVNLLFLAPHNADGRIPGTLNSLRQADAAIRGIEERIANRPTGQNSPTEFAYAMQLYESILLDGAEGTSVNRSALEGFVMRQGHMRDAGEVLAYVRERQLDQDGEERLSDVATDLIQQLSGVRSIRPEDVQIDVARRLVDIVAESGDLDLKAQLDQLYSTADLNGIDRDLVRRLNEAFPPVINNPLEFAPRYAAALGNPELASQLLNEFGPGLPEQMRAALQEATRANPTTDEIAAVRTVQDAANLHARYEHMTESAAMLVDSRPATVTPAESFQRAVEPLQSILPSLTQMAAMITALTSQQANNGNNGNGSTNTP